MSQNCHFTLSEGVLTLGNDLFSKSFLGIQEAKSERIAPKSRSLPYLEISATKADGTLGRYQMWEDLPVVRIVEGAEDPLLVLEGEHWILRSVKLHAFSDNRDAMVEENEYSFFKRGLFQSVEGEIFFLEDPETERAILIISETPDWIRGVLSAPIDHESDPAGAVRVSLENGGYPIVLGFCKRGECESLCRSYLRHANCCKTLLAMSNTWGDRNGRERICEEFIRGEIQAASEIGVDVMQIDDGWQAGNTIYPRQRDERGNQIFYDNYWDMNTDRFPNGIKPLTELAASKGIRLGLWFAPSSHDCFAKLERDKEVLRNAYEKEGARFFKLDMYQAASREATDKMLSLLDSIYSLGDDVSVQMDVTRYERLNYLCGREYGTIFVENRFTRGIYAYYPHRVLRNLWNISRYIPSNRFQFEMVNPDLFRTAYGERDPFAPDLYDMDYLFAAVMLSNPLFWMELQFLGEKRRRELAPLLSVWKEHREALAKADIMPIGERPSGRSFTGFYVSSGEDRYLLLFREVTDENCGSFKLPIRAGKAETLASNADVTVTVKDGFAVATFSKPRSYAFIKIK
ncbi:MAG: alpha-galactosidase [Clostridia bacterium]|nr:alpha-galactosidase [Clostridia bacterium]